MAVESTWLQVQGLRIHCLVAGESGSPVLLLHGGGLDSASLSYASSIGAIASEHRVWAPDLPGYGDSDKPAVRYTVEYYIDFLAHFMSALGLQRASLVGLSLGGAIALGTALQRPERVDRLVLVDSHGLGPAIPYGWLGWLLVHTPLLNELSWALLGLNRAIVRRSLEALVCDRAAIDDELVEEVYRLVRQPRVGAAWRSLQRDETRWLHSRTDYVWQLAAVTAPALILHGQGDTLVPVAWAERAHELIAGSELRVIPGVRHWLPREKPLEFARLVLDFLARR